MGIKSFEQLSGEISGSIGDLGTFLPYIIGVIIIGGMDATGVLVTFGLMYIFTAWFYRMPMPVQPMKIIGAAVIIHHLTPGEVAAAGLMMGLTLLFFALTGLVEKLAGLTPAAVTFGIQAGLGISLAALGIKYIKTDFILGLIVLLLILLLSNNKKFPASIIGVVGGTLLAFFLHPELSLPSVSWGIHMPHLVWPQWADFNRGFTLGFLPQLPLTLTNSVLVSAVLAHELYPERSQRATEKNLCLTLGIGNLIAVPLGGFAMCHGSGGLTAHYRFGGRTGLTLVIIGSLLLLTGIFLGPAGVKLLKIIPQPVLGCLLFYSGVDLVRGVKDLGNKDSMFIFAVVLVSSITINPAIGFAAGLFLTLLVKKGWVKN
ncbi:MAG: putative sulfate/molybdate transporter [Syntrophomonas sp.]